MENKINVFYFTLCQPNKLKLLGLFAYNSPNFFQVTEHGFKKKMFL